MKIIVMDDELLQLKTIIEYLEEIVEDADVCAFQKTSEVLEFLEKEKADLAILDIRMPGKINGIGLAAQMKHMIPEIKILFCTGYTEYAFDAFQVHANGYLCKPIVKEELQRELNYIFSKEREKAKAQKPFLHTFGNFDLFVNGSPVKFKRSKSKEALAWLTDRKGTWVTNQELMAAMWEEYSFDTPIAKYASLLISDLIADLEQVGVSQIIERRRGRLRLRTEEVNCDYFDLLAGDDNAIKSFCSEYMSQYSWGEVTLSGLMGNLYG